MMMEEALVDSGRARGVSYALVYTPPPTLYPPLDAWVRLGIDSLDVCAARFTARLFVA